MSTPLVQVRYFDDGVVPLRSGILRTKSEYTEREVASSTRFESLQKRTEGSVFAPGRVKQNLSFTPTVFFSPRVSGANTPPTAPTSAFPTTPPVNPPSQPHSPKMLDTLHYFASAGAAASTRSGTLSLSSSTADAPALLSKVAPSTRSGTSSLSSSTVAPPAGMPPGKPPGPPSWDMRDWIWEKLSPPICPRMEGSISVRFLVVDAPVIT
mmetsp:Transcript_18791/g.47245  ORF Transcript_18791/g.47245 Transcript_18791/m.47245 type:complete len:210 (+) Transcript_18791:370-999(+)